MSDAVSERMDGVELARNLAAKARLLYESRDFDQAVALGDQALAHDPDNAELLNAAGIYRHAAGHLAEAVLLYRRATGLQPGFAAAWTNLGKALTDLNRRALAISADTAPSWSNLGRKPPNLAPFDEAIACHRQALGLQPKNARFRQDLAVALTASGIALRALDKLRDAVSRYREAIGLVPDSAAIWSNLGNALKDLKEIESAIQCHRRAVALAPDSPGFRFNLGIALAAAPRPVEAIAALDGALALAPQDAHLRWDRALNHLRLGNYQQGWQDYAARLETGMLPGRTLPGRPWIGAGYPRQRLLILCEQGFGDTIWAARYLRQAKALGGELILECQAPLIPLIAELGIIDHLVAKGDPLPDADWHCHMCSLPGLFNATLLTISGDKYLPIPVKASQQIQSTIARAGSALKIGIIWSGSVTFKGNRDRAAPLKRFIDAFALPGIQLFSLQKGPPAAELAKLPQAPIIDLAPLLNDFADTAIAIDALDLVIMTDSAVAHLAGALGKPVWVLVNHVSHWLWLLERNDCPWYQSLRLYRARSWHSWAGVFDAASADLLQMLVDPNSVQILCRDALNTGPEPEIPRFEISYSVKGAHDHAVLLLQGKTAYNGLAGYNRETARILRAAHIESFIIDIDQSLQGQLNTALSKYPAERILAAFSFGGIGLEIGDDMPEGNLWQRLRIPLLNWQGDHPCYSLRRHMHSAPAGLRIYISKEFQDFNTQYLRAPYRSGLCQLGARNYGHSPQQRQFKRGTTPLIIFPKSGNNPAELEAGWRNLPALTQKIIRDAFDHYWGQTPRSGSVVTSVLTAADSAGVELRNDLPLFSFFIAQIDDYVRRIKTRIVINDIRSLPVQIYGKNLDYIDTTGARAAILPPIDYAALTGLFHEALGVVTFNPNVDDIGHDRIYSAFGCRALPISDINPWMENNYPELIRYGFDFRDRLPSIAVERVLADPAEAAQIAWNLGARAINDWPVEASVTRCLDLAAQHRAITFDYKPLQKFFMKLNDRACG